MLILSLQAPWLSLYLTWIDLIMAFGFRMDPESADSSSQPLAAASDVEHSAAAVSLQDSNAHQTPSISSSSGISSWTRSLKFPHSFGAAQEDSQNGNARTSTFARFTSGLGLRISPVANIPAENSEGVTETAQSGVLESFTKGLVDSSRSAVKAMQVKARHIVSQNKRRYMVAHHSIAYVDFLFHL